METVCVFVWGCIDVRWFGAGAYRNVLSVELLQLLVCSLAAAFGLLSVLQTIPICSCWFCSIWAFFFSHEPEVLCFDRMVVLSPCVPQISVRMTGVWACLKSSVCFSGWFSPEGSRRSLPSSHSRPFGAGWCGCAMGALQALQVLHHRTAEGWRMAVSSCGSIHAGTSFQTMFWGFLWYHVRKTAIQIISCNVTMRLFIMQKESKTIKSVHLCAVIPGLNDELTGR